MLREIRKIKTLNKRKYIYILQYRKFIKRYINEKGYVCYDAEEYKQWHKQAKIGRPPKE